MPEQTPPLTRFLDQRADEAVAELATLSRAGKLDRAELEALHAAETAGKGRQSVLGTLAQLIDQATAEGAQGRASATRDPHEAPSQAPAPSAGGEGADKVARGEIPEWRKPEYTGPLSADQAVWRNANLRTK